MFHQLFSVGKGIGIGRIVLDHRRVAEFLGQFLRPGPIGNIQTNPERTDIQCPGQPNAGGGTAHDDNLAAAQFTPPKLGQNLVENGGGPHQGQLIADLQPCFPQGDKGPSLSEQPKMWSQTHVY